MSKRPTNATKFRDHHRRANERISVELNLRMLNVSASGCFYERAKSRRLRTNEVFRSTSEGQAVVNEAVPLGLKRKLSGDRSQKAKGVLMEGKEAMQRMKVGIDAGASAKKEHPKGTSNEAEFDSSVVDLTKESESGSDLEESIPIVQTFIGDIVIATHSRPDKHHLQESLFHLCMQDTLDLNAISDLIASKEEASHAVAKTSDTFTAPKKNDMNLAIWACCHAKRSSRHYSALLLLLNAGADANVIYRTFKNKSCRSPAPPVTYMTILDLLYDLHLSFENESVTANHADFRYLREVTRVLLSSGAKFHHHAEVLKAKDWVETFQCVE
ncbi:hypothetical protein HJC23_013344 [Cyclotella cryptica]|uniref:Uncharacterized protein n=1 Tax=Cyclotella cryptica TaxID=29204 RepID=A0ABD3P806_9STRA|eukprot:CCRYP_016852-RA/>CCRYP_016852-RA protein AED:0.24 eAED:0.24 QI:0/-1/0/1/-1/1/1/0/327